MNMVMARRLTAGIVGLVLCLVVLPAEPCTTFCLRDGERIVFAKNYDWNVGSGMVVVNQRWVSRVADATGGGTRARWTRAEQPTGNFDAETEDMLCRVLAWP